MSAFNLDDLTWLTPPLASELRNGHLHVTTGCTSDFWQPIL